MDQNDHDWEKRLTTPPLPGKGFNDRLRRRVEEQLDHKEARRRHWFWPAASLCSVFALSAFVWLANPFDWGRGFKADALTNATAATDSAYVSVPELESAAENPVVKTGVLIGLRQDYTPTIRSSAPVSENTASTYRTLMLAPVDGKVSIAAEGSGILVPYGQKFWKIDALTHTTDTDMIHYLSVRPADKPAEALDFEDRPEEKLLHTEKLLFAGNQYLSVAEEENIITGNSRTGSNQVWVRKLNQMTGPSLNGSSADLQETESYVTVEDIFGEGARQVLSGLGVYAEEERSPEALPQATDHLRRASLAISGDNWAIIRQPGRWVAQVAQPLSIQANRTLEYELVNYPAALPEVVTSHDEVVGTWGEIKALQPKATDLLTSPLEDLMIVWTDKELVLYSPGSSTSDSKPLLQVELEPGEKLVSAQWATGSYVADWVVKSQKYLQGSYEEGR